MNRKTDFLPGEKRPDDAVLYASKLQGEVVRLFQSEGWKIETVSKGIRIESVQFADSRLKLMRSSAELSVQDQNFFEKLMTPEGFALLDPVSSPDSHRNPPLETYIWKPGARLEAATAEAKLPLLPRIHFVVLNAIDTSQLLFVSKSIIHDRMPANGIRGLNSFALKVDINESGTIRLQIMNWIDTGLKVPAFLMNRINRRFLMKLNRTVSRFTN